MQRDQSQRRLGGDEPAKIRHPAGSAKAGPATGSAGSAVGRRRTGGRRRRSHSPDRAHGRVAVSIAIFGKLLVDVWLVADLECRDRLPADPADQRLASAPASLGLSIARLMPRISCAPSARRARRSPASRRALARNPRRGLHYAGDRPPCLVRAVAADPQDGRLAGRQVADESHQHRVDRSGVSAGVRRDRAVFHRQADEPRG